MKLLETVYILDGMIFIYIMIISFLFFYTENKKNVQILPKESFCTCRGAQYNNSSADVNQYNCYKNKIPPKIWEQSYGGCTSFDDPGKISYNYEINEKQLPQFMGV